MEGDEQERGGWNEREKISVRGMRARHKQRNDKDNVERKHNNKGSASGREGMKSENLILELLIITPATRKMFTLMTKTFNYGWLTSEY